MGLSGYLLSCVVIHVATITNAAAIIKTITPSTSYSLNTERGPQQGTLQIRTHPPPVKSANTPADRKTLNYVLKLLGDNLQPQKTSRRSRKLIVGKPGIQMEVFPPSPQAAMDSSPKGKYKTNLASLQLVSGKVDLNMQILKLLLQRLTSNDGKVYANYVPVSIKTQPRSGLQAFSVTQKGKVNRKIKAMNKLSNVKMSQLGPNRMSYGLFRQVMSAIGNRKAASRVQAILLIGSNNVPEKIRQKKVKKPTNTRRKPKAKKPVVSRRPAIKKIIPKKANKLFAPKVVKFLKKVKSLKQKFLARRKTTKGFRPRVASSYRKLGARTRPVVRATSVRKFASVPTDYVLYRPVPQPVKFMWPPQRRQVISPVVNQFDSAPRRYFQRRNFELNMNRNVNNARYSSNTYRSLPALEAPPRGYWQDGRPAPYTSNRVYWSRQTQPYVVNEFETAPATRF